MHLSVDYDFLIIISSWSFLEFYGHQGSRIYLFQKLERISPKLLHTQTHVRGLNYILQLIYKLYASHTPGVCHSLYAPRPLPP